MKKRLKKKLKKYFFSHSENHHRPHILREVTLIAIMIFGVFLIGVSFGRYYFLHKTVLGQEIVSSVLIDLTNETRQKYGQSTLIRNPKLESAAAMKATDMATYEYFAHNSPSGVTPWYWIKKAGYDFLYAGENLAIDFTQSQDVSEAWLKSPTHKANILNSKFEEIGISTKSGMIDGHNTIYVVQMFGTPKALAETTTPAPAPSSPEKSVEKSVAPPMVQTSPEKSIHTDKSNTPKNEVVISPTSTEEVVEIVQDGNMVVAADKNSLTEDNTRVLGEFAMTKPGHYANFWQKLIYNFWYEVNIFYKILVSAIGLGIFLLFFSEFKKHHWKHISYGVGTIIILLLLLYINQNLW